MALEYFNILNQLGLNQAGGDANLDLSNPVAAAYRYLLQPYGQRGGDMQAAQLFAPTGGAPQVGGGMQGMEYLQDLAAGMPPARAAQAQQPAYSSAAQRGALNVSQQAAAPRAFGPRRFAQTADVSGRYAGADQGAAVPPNLISTDPLTGQQYGPSQYDPTTGMATKDRVQYVGGRPVTGKPPAGTTTAPVLMDDSYAYGAGLDTTPTRAEAPRTAGGLQTAGFSRAPDTQQIAQTEQGVQTGTSVGQQTQTGPLSATASYFKNPLSSDQLQEIANNSTYRVGDNTIYSGRIGVEINERGEPKNFIYYDENGNRLTRSAFSPTQFLKHADLFNIDPTQLLGIEKGLSDSGIGYKPYEYFSGTGSDLGFDFRDFLSGGMGTAYDWTKDPNVFQKGPSAAATLAENQRLAQQFGLKYNQDKYQGGGIREEAMNPLQGGTSAPRGYAMMGPGNSFAGWYETLEKAEAAAKQYGGRVIDLTGKTTVSQDNRNRLQQDEGGNWILRPPGGATGGGFYVEDGQGHFGPQSPLQQMDRLYRR